MRIVLKQVSRMLNNIDNLTTEDPQTISDNNEEDKPMHEAINGDNDNKHDESNDEELDDLWENHNNCLIHRKNLDS